MNSNNNLKNTLGALISGVVVGALGIILADKRNRDKLKSKANELRVQAKRKISDIAKDVDGAKEEAQEKLSQSLKRAGRRLEKNGDVLSRQRVVS